MSGLLKTHSRLSTAAYLQDSVAFTEMLRQEDGFGDIPFVRIEPRADVDYAVTLKQDSLGCEIIINGRTHVASVVAYRLIQIWPFLRTVLQRSKARNLVFNVGDEGSRSEICFCGSSPDLTLIPDSEFLYFDGYQYARAACERQPAWSERSDNPYWRGSPTGIQHGSIFDLPRVRLCQVAFEHGFDCLLTDMHQIRAEDASLIKDAGLIGERAPWSDVIGKRYNIDIDGNSSAWSGLFQKLLAGGVVLKVSSPYRQWYYDALKPWVNFVPIQADLSDLASAVAILRSNQAMAEEIAAAGRKLALDMTYDRAVDIGLANIAKRPDPAEEAVAKAREVIYRHEMTKALEGLPGDPFP